MGDSGRQQGNAWPLPTFYFSVTIGNMEMQFQEVSGLDIEAQIIEYRSGNSTQFSTIKMPGLKKYGNITLKKGMVQNSKDAMGFFSKIKLNTIERNTVTIKLLDEKGNATMLWKLINAFPTKITGADLKADGNEMAIETMELAHEGLQIVNQ
jgi:phage tail-like protein